MPRTGRFQLHSPEERRQFGREGGTARWVIYRQNLLDRYRKLAREIGWDNAVLQAWHDGKRSGYDAKRLEVKRARS